MYIPVTRPKTAARRSRGGIQDDGVTETTHTRPIIMKTTLRILKWIAVAAVVVIAALVLFIFVRADRTYEAPYPDITVSQDSVLIARGRHLVFGPAHCAGCHTPRPELDAYRRGEDVSLAGGEDFNLPIGTIHTPNITPDVETGIGAYTDEEIARALRYGVKRNGQALMDFMPFYDLSDRDLSAIVSYLRSVPAVRNERPRHEWNFMGKAVRAFGLIRPMGDGEVPPAPPEDTTAAYGRYVAGSIANCRGCHTKRDLMTGGFIGDDYVGGMVFESTASDGSEGYYVSPNLTPDPETGRIATWSKELFIQRFQEGAMMPGSPMPWTAFRRMSDIELTAIYKYLQSLEPLAADPPIPVGLQTGEMPEGI